MIEKFSKDFTGMVNFAFLVVIGVTNFKQVQLVLLSNCIFPCSFQNLSRITSYFHNTPKGVHMVVLPLSIMLMEHCHFPDYSAVSTIISLVSFWSKPPEIYSNVHLPFLVKFV